MDKASDFELEDCVFESRHSLLLFRLLINVTKIICKIKNNVVQTLIAKVFNCKELLTNWHSDIAA